MDPKEFDWNETQQVTVTNPTKNDYRFKVFNKDYEVKAGRTARMPGYHAMLFVDGLAKLMAQEDKKFANMIDPELRKEYHDKIIVGADPVMQDIDIVEDSGDVEDLSLPEAPGRGRPAKV
jgi:hypothetical protein